jgi:hypothetical protein
MFLPLPSEVTGYTGCHNYNPFGLGYNQADIIMRSNQNYLKS